MRKKAENILSLNSLDAMNFFMKSEQYHGFELPEYFVFDEILKSVQNKIGDARYEDCIQTEILPENLSDVNLDILLNKDGKYAVRPIILANPYLYYFLVRELCNEKGWQVVQELFAKFKVPHITSCALPVIAEEGEPFHKATTILNWWNTIEQRSIELSLEYRYMFVTDITNCYGSINPQSIEWAFGMKNTRYENDEHLSIAQNVQHYLRAMQQGRNIGIPQGSALFDFLSEIILGYADLLLYEEIDNQGISTPFEILRYRDDYRIFCNDKGVLEKISYILQHVLEGLNFRMNSNKTKVCDSIVTDAVKPDKLYYIFNTPVFNRKGGDFDGLQKYLMFVLQFARKFPNSGQIKVLLSNIDKRVRKRLTPHRQKCKLSEMLGFKFGGHSLLKEQTVWTEVPGDILENVRAMSAICVQIALENVSVSHYALMVLSRMVDSLDDEQEKTYILDRVYEKLHNQPNSTYNQLWLQNITYLQDKKNGSSPYSMPLCKLAAGDTSVELWNNQWIKPELTQDFPTHSAVDQEVLKIITPVITFRERRAYEEMMG